MKKIIIMFVVGSFFGIGIFGFSVMSHEGGHSHQGCIAAVSRGLDCPKSIHEAIYFALFHIGAFNNFFSVSFGDNLLYAFLLCAALLYAARACFLSSLSFCVLRFKRTYYRVRDIAFSFKRDFISWLALHENSPAFFKASI